MPNPPNVPLDVNTVNAIIKMLEEDIAPLDPNSEASIALWRFKEKLSNL